MKIEWLSREFVVFVGCCIPLSKFAHIQGDTSTSGGERCHIGVTVKQSWTVL